MANFHGGKRENAGRKAGKTNAKTREIAEKAIEQGITPLEVILEAMRFHYTNSQTAELSEKGDHLAKAAIMAEKAAPFIHPRLAAIEHTGKDGGAIEVKSWNEMPASEKIQSAKELAFLLNSAVAEQESLH